MHLVLPDLARAVPVDLDAVMVGVAEIERLADEVIRRAGERNPLARRVREPARQVGALRQQKRVMEEARVPVGRRRTRLLDEMQELGPARAEARLAVPLVEHVEADRAAVVVERARQIRHREVHGTEARRVGQRQALELSDTR